ncbi:MAG: hypothetical protein Q4E75_04270 [bacterium]|nr:hypothetical protein [bacterium]
MKYYIETINKLIDKVKNIELISETSNKVFKVTTESNEILYVKFYENNSYHIDLELKLYNLIDNKYLKELYCEPLNSSVAVFRKLVGKTIDELNNEELIKYSDKIIDSLCDYLDTLSLTKVNGYGALDNNLNGKYDNFINFLKERQGSTSKQLKNYRDLTVISDIIFDEYEDIIFSDNSLTPIDNNMKNIMLTNDGNIKFIDPGEMISAPILMGYGDFVAHSYKTILYDKLIKKLKLTKNDEKLLRIYAIFSSLNILAFLSKLGVDNLDSVIPYGNTYTFYNLIFDHLENLNIGREKVKEYSIKKNNS